MRTSFFGTLALFGLASLAAIGCTTAAKQKVGETTGESSSAALTSQETLTGRQTLRGFYREVLAREPSDAEVVAWEDQIKRGTPVLDAAKVFLAAPEHRKLLVTQYYRRFLRRDPDAAALQAWSTHPQLVAGHPHVALAGILGSPEYFAKKGGNNSSFVWGLYRDVLGRDPSPSEVGGWLPLANVNREQAAAGFLSSDEQLNRMITEWYSRYLHRALDAQGAANLLGHLHAHASHFDLQAAILASPEYASVHTCRPKTCVGEGKQCGSISNGCGGTVQCGDCADTHSCSDQNKCEPKCEPLSCGELLADCGSVDDGCGRTIHCGVCPYGQSCGAGGIPNACGGGALCEPYTCEKMGFTCGRFSDSCGGVLDCGPCGAVLTR